MSLKKKKILSISIIAISMITIISSLSYAYFTAIPEAKPQDVSLTSGIMSLRFADNDTGVSATLNFGETVTKKFVLENTGTVDATAKINWLDLINTYTNGSLTYTLSYSETENGSYHEVVSKTNVPISKNPLKKMLATDLTVPAGEVYYYDLVITLNYLEDVNQDDDLIAAFNSKFEVVDITSYTPTEKIIALSNGVRIDFDEPATTDEGVFEMEDDYGTSYYYRGAVENNYVKFADLYWRIIRVNGDGSLRIIYDGTSAHTNGEYSDDRFSHRGQKFNSYVSDNKYVGWMYGPAGTATSTSKVQAQTNTTSSDIKILVESWYKTNIVDKGYSAAVSDTMFCNDRSIPGKDITGDSNDTGLGYGSNYTNFGAPVRTGKWNANIMKIAPTFKCPQKNDAFTVSDTSKGNGALTYPVGLITADEVVAAGSGKFAIANQKYYLYRGNTHWFWTSSPFAASYADVMIIHTDGHLGSSYVNNPYGAVAPVINLSSDYAVDMIGTGTMNDPYRIKGVSA